MRQFRRVLLQQASSKFIAVQRRNRSISCKHKTRRLIRYQDKGIRRVQTHAVLEQEQEQEEQEEQKEQEQKEQEQEEQEQEDLLT